MWCKLFRCWWLVFVVCCLFSLVHVLSAGDVPAPFGKAKQYALRAKPDSDGDYNLVFEFMTDSGDKVVYLFGYTKNHGGIIAIGKGEGGLFIVLMYQESTGEMRVWVNGFVYMIENREKALEWAFSIFRELVARKAI